MKRINKIVLCCILTFITIIPLSACKSEQEKPSTTESERNKLYLSGGSCYYNDMYFNTGMRIPRDRNSYTLEYVLFDSDDLVKLPVYSDAFDENSDPFLGQSNSSQILVDEEATRNNNGIPVLIVASTVRNEDGAWQDTFVSFNMATNRLTLIRSLSERIYGKFALLGDTIYYSVFLGDPDSLDMTGEYAYYRMSKNGGNPERLPFPETERLPYTIKYVYNGKLYLVCEQIGKAYRCNPDFTQMEIVWESFPKSSPVAFHNGYAYYETNFRTVSTDNGVNVECFDYFKTPVENMSEEHSEMVLEDVLWVLHASDHSSEVYYNSLDDLQISTISLVPTHSILKSLNLETGKEVVVFDYSAQSEPFYTTMYCNDKYCAIMIINHPDYPLGAYLLNRETGELKLFDGFN